MGVRGSKIALLFQYNKGNENTIFLLLSKVTFQANRVNKESGQSVKLCSKGLNCPRRTPGGLQGWNSRLQRGQRLMQEGRQKSLQAALCSGPWLSRSTPVTPELCKFGQATIPIFATCNTRICPFESCRYNLLEQNGFILLSLNPSADSDAEDKFHHKKTHLRSRFSCEVSSIMCWTLVCHSCNSQDTRLLPARLMPTLT